MEENDQDKKSPQRRGKNAETAIAIKLSKMGYFVRMMPIGSPFDLLVNDKRVEIKRSGVRGDMGWEMNLHRHGVLNESKVDAYIFMLDCSEWNKKRPIYLVFLAPLGKLTFRISFPQLNGCYHGNIDNWSLLGEPFRR